MNGLENGDVVISQNPYAESLEHVKVDPNDDSNRPLNRHEFKSNRGLVGKLSWLSEMTRPAQLLYHYRSPYLTLHLSCRFGLVTELPLPVSCPCKPD